MVEHAKAFEGLRSRLGALLLDPGCHVLVPSSGAGPRRKSWSRADYKFKRVEERPDSHQLKQEPTAQKEIASRSTSELPLRRDSAAPVEQPATPTTASFGLSLPGWPGAGLLSEWRCCVLEILDHGDGSSAGSGGGCGSGNSSSSRCGISVYDSSLWHESCSSCAVGTGSCSAEGCCRNEKHAAAPPAPVWRLWWHKVTRSTRLLDRVSPTVVVWGPLLLDSLTWDYSDMAFEEEMMPVSGIGT